MEQQRKMGFLTADKPGDQGERMNTEKKIRKKKDRERERARRGAQASGIIESASLVLRAGCLLLLWRRRRGGRFVNE
jgi:hypothetical protein